MAILWARPIWDDRDYNSGGFTDQTVVRAWKVRSDSIDESQLAVAAAVGIQQYDPWSENVFLTARRITVTGFGDDPRFWLVQVTFSSEPLKKDEKDKQQFQNPLERPPKVRWNRNNYTEVFDRDINGKGVVNAAGDYYDPQPEIDRARWTCTIQANVVGVPVYILTYENVTNSSPFKIFRCPDITVETKKARLCAVEIGELQEEGGVEYYVFTYSIEFNKLGWNKRIPNMGFNKLVPGTGTGGNNKVKIKLPHPDFPNDRSMDTDATVPQQLDESGDVIPNPTIDTVIYNEHEGYEAVDFTTLPGLSAP